jgi:polysaccharide biosynthesis/export protein
VLLALQCIPAVIRLALLAAFLLAVAACAQHTPPLNAGGAPLATRQSGTTGTGVQSRTGTIDEADRKPLDQPSPSILPAYRVGPGDVIEVVYHIRHQRSQDSYRLELRDKITIYFPYHPQFTTTVLVRPDGKITVPLIGDVEAESKTPAELAATLNTRYSKFLNAPNITISLEVLDNKVEELRRAITSNDRGQSRLVTIGLDGLLAFPFIGELQAEGRTLRQLETAVNQRYTQVYNDLHASLILREIHHPKVYVLGEVKRPGAYEMRSRINLVDALALAEGHTRNASLKHIIVFRNEGLEQPAILRADLDAMLRHGHVTESLLLCPADIVYVPKSALDDFDDWVEKVFTKGLYAIIPFQTIFNLNTPVN